MNKKKIGFIVLSIAIVFAIIVWPKKQMEEAVVLEKEAVIAKVQFEIKGAITNPGVYELEENSRVVDAIKLGGGLLENADISTTNQSKLIEDEMVIIIYTKEEIAELKQGSASIKYIDNTCVCPQIKNDACIDQKITNIDMEEQSSGKVSLNHATLEQLMTLSGIGEIKAKAIIAYREEKGGFKSLDELAQVKGIGQKTYEKIQEFLTL